VFISAIKNFNFSSVNNNSNIVIIALHKLGDSVFTIPAIREIEKYYKTDINVVCFSETCDIYKLVFTNLNFINLSKTDFYFGGRIASRKARRVIKSLKPKNIFDLTGSITSVSLIYNSRAEEIIGTSENIYKSIYTKFKPIRKEPHITDIYLDAVKLLIPVKDDTGTDITVKKSKDGYILIHPFAGWIAKEWRLKNFVNLAEKLNKDNECVIVYPEKSIKEDILKEMDNKKIKHVETKTTLDLIKVIEGASVFIGNDSGPIQIANLIGIPTFTIYGPTNPDYHKPINGLNSFIFKKIGCSPKYREKVCFTNGGRFGCPSNECMNNIEVKEVEEKILTFVNNVELDFVKWD